MRPFQRWYAGLLIRADPMHAVLLIAVGPAVTHRPPPRSRRAVFSHRAPQYYSLPLSARSLHNGHSGLSGLRYAWPWYLEVFQHLFEAVPFQALLLTSPIQP